MHPTFQPIIDGLCGVRANLGGLPTRDRRLEREIAGMRGGPAELSTRMDRVTDRIDRIEHRLDWRDA